ncbi:MAG: TonB-dependent receptor, partial [Gemmatimonadetes bacterium]|nr:TonB-dependent receptor [Gemmatimonadota bacterium]
MLSAVLLLLATSAGDLQGVVRSHPSGEPVPHATVRVQGLGRATATDERGHFVIAGVPAGRYVLRGSALGHDSASAEVVVTEGARVWTELRLPHRAVQLEAVEVRGDAAASLRVAGPSAVRMDVGALKALPSLAEPDVLRGVQSLPSVSAASDFSSALYVRGGSPDQTLVRLDGAPLFNPFHLGGLFSAIDPDAVASVEVHAGALPAAAGDRVSGAVDIWTREGGRDRARARGAVSLISTRAAVDGPLPGGRGSVLASVRRTYVDALAATARGLGITSRSFPYSFSDAHLKLTHDLGRGGRVSASAYVNGEAFQLPPDWGVGAADWRWGSRAAGATWRQVLGATTVATASAAASMFDGRLTTGDSAGRGERTVAWSEMRSLSATGQVSRFGRAYRLTGGLALEVLLLDHDVEDLGPGGLGDYLSPLDRSDRPRTVSGFTEGEWLPSERSSARLGVRVLHVADGATVVMPRAGLRFLLTERWSVTAGGGAYAQAITTLRDEESIVSGVFAYDLLVAAPADRPARAHDAVVGVAWGAGCTSGRREAYRTGVHELLRAALAPVPRA